MVHELLKTSEETNAIKDFLNIKDFPDRTALHWASEGGHKEVVQELLKTSERTEIINELLVSKDTAKQTALHLASYAHRSRIR